MRTYKHIAGAPMLRVRDDGVVFGACGKPILFTGYGESTTMVLAGKVRRVKRADVLRCAETGENLALLAMGRNGKYKGVKKDVLDRYNEMAGNISLFVSAMMEGDKGKVLQHLYSRIPNYVAHFHYLNVNAGELYDIIAECCVELCEDIMQGRKVVVAPDNYIIRMARTKLAKLFDKIRKKAG